MFRAQIQEDTHSRGLAGDLEVMLVSPLSPPCSTHVLLFICANSRVPMSLPKFQIHPCFLFLCPTDCLSEVCVSRSHCLPVFSKCFLGSCLSYSGLCQPHSQFTLCSLFPVTVLLCSVLKVVSSSLHPMKQAGGVEWEFGSVLVSGFVFC